MEALDRSRSVPPVDALVDRFLSTSPGGLVTHHEIMEILGTEDMPSSYGSVSVAAKRLRLGHRRAIHNVRGKGYRVAFAREHVLIGEIIREKAEVQLGKATEVVEATDLALLSADELCSWTAHRNQLATLYGVVKFHDDVLRRHEDLINSLTREVELIRDVTIPRRRPPRNA